MKETLNNAPYIMVHCLAGRVMIWYTMTIQMMY